MPLHLQLASTYLAYANKNELAITKNELSKTFFVNETPFGSSFNIILTFIFKKKTAPLYLIIHFFKALSFSSAYFL